MPWLPFVLATLLMPAAIAWSGPIKAGEPGSTKPELTVDVRVTANRQVFKPDTVIPLRRGQSVQLQVEVVHKDGRAMDVTADFRTQYVSAAPWIVSVSDAGLVTATAELAQQYQIDPSGRDRGVVMVTYGLAGDRDRGAAAVRFEVRGKPGETVEEVLVVTAPKTTLRVGETVQLRVTNRLRDRSIEDLTDPSTGTRYFTTAESRLVPEPDGRVTCISTDSKPEESAIIGVRNGEAWGDISFKLLPGGPGPGLHVAADKTVLREGERTQLYVYRPLPDGSRAEVTATWSGTRYLTFTGYGKVDTTVIGISDMGLVVAPPSIGRYNRRTIIVLVRNGDDVGWIELKVIPAQRK